MAYESKKYIGGSLTIHSSKLAGNPAVDSYAFEKEQDGIVYKWTGVKVSYMDNDGTCHIHLPQQLCHATGGPYTYACE
jgi:hypothetical protein